jgi:hypothetical protein
MVATTWPVMAVAERLLLYEVLEKIYNIPKVLVLTKSSLTTPWANEIIFSRAQMVT